MLERIFYRIHRWRVKRRRRKLLSAYAKIGRIRHDLGPGISPTLYAYDRVCSKGLADIVVHSDGEVDLVWHWPEESAGGEAHAGGPG